MPSTKIFRTDPIILRESNPRIELLPSEGPIVEDTPGGYVTTLRTTVEVDEVQKRFDFSYFNAGRIAVLTWRNLAILDLRQGFSPPWIPADTHCPLEPNPRPR